MEAPKQKIDRGAEFDGYADHYGAGMENPAKRLAGASPEDFLKPKIDLLAGLIDNLPESASLLDFGCGTGGFAALIQSRWPSLGVEGCDLSEGMLDEAVRRGTTLNLWKYDGRDLPFERYDLVTAVCVFHHICPSEWVVVANRIRKALKPGGRFVLIEHNPWNPVTSWVVAHTAIDANAVLLSANTARRIFREAGLRTIQVQNFLFFPPRLVWLRPVDRALGGVPLGGQYFLVAENAVRGTP